MNINNNMTKHLNLLMIIPYAPTLIRTRPYNLLKGLLRNGHKVTLATLWENEAERKALDEWRALGANVLACELTRKRKLINLILALPTRKPLQSVYCLEPKLLQLIQENWLEQSNKGEKYSAVHIEHLRGAQYGLAIKQWIQHLDKIEAHTRQPLFVWDSVDCISLLFEKAARGSRSLFGRIATSVDLPRTRGYEGWLVNQFDHTLVTSEIDRDALGELGDVHQSKHAKKYQVKISKPPITVLPNGVDLETFIPNYGERKKATIVMTGKMSYHANVTAVFYLVESVMPLVWEKCPEAKVQIVGANPPADIRAMASRYPGNVDVTGTVPSVAAYLREATLAAAPIAYGVGIQNKVLEAMACATPLVCTSQAVSALKAKPGHDLLVCDSPDELAHDILRLLSDSVLCNSVGAAGRHYVEAWHSWAAIVMQLEEIYQAVV